MITGDFLHVNKLLPVQVSLYSWKIGFQVVIKFLLDDAVQETDVGVSVASGTWY